MKHMKKVITLLLAAVMVLAMSSVVFADAPTSGTITVNPNYEGQTYTLYKLFDAHITFGTDGTTVKAITYTIPGKETTATTEDLGDGSEWFKVNSNHFVEPVDGLAEDWAKDPDAIAWAKSFGQAVDGAAALTAAQDNDPDVKWEDIPFGYYFVETTLGSFVGIDSSTPDVTIEDKNEKPSVDKEIVSTTNGEVGNDPDKTSETDTGTNEAATAQVGDTVNYKLTVTAKPGAENYVVTDTLSAGLTPCAASAVTAACDAPAIAATDYEVDVTGQVITVTFKQAYLDKITADATITITYSATLNKDAVIGEAGNPNTVRLTWGHEGSEDVNYSDDDAKVYTAQVAVNKKDDSGEPLEGAGFVVKNSENKYYKLVDGLVTWVADIDDADEHLSLADGTVAPFTGLSNGTYTLVEKTVPDGYNSLGDTEFTIADNDYTDTNLKQTEEVTNKAGATLPSTGGIGTIIFYALGSILVIGCGIVLISRRRTNTNK